MTISHLPNPITELNQLDLQLKYSYADYLTWEFEERVEIINGKIFIIPPPAPTPEHQRVSRNLTTDFTIHQRKIKAFEVFSAPFDVRFPKTPETSSSKIYDVVQPDLCIVCDLEKIDKRGCNGSPDLIVEILSKGTASKDIGKKFKLYEKNKVKEHWIVHPNDQTVLVYTLDKKGKYSNGHLYYNKEKVKVSIFKDLEIDLAVVFDVS